MGHAAECAGRLWVKSVRRHYLSAIYTVQFVLTSATKHIIIPGIPCFARRVHFTDFKSQNVYETIVHVQTNILQRQPS